MNTDTAHKRGWQIFEVVFGVPFLVAIILQFVVPLSFPSQIPTLILILGGVVLIIVGLVFVVLARREFTQFGQLTDPGHPTTRIIITGVFSISRNPIYLGGVCLLAGIALAANLPWALISLLPALVACHYILIMPEERYLAARFGKEYADYTASVHRWIGRARRSNS